MSNDKRQQRRVEMTELIRVLATTTSLITRGDRKGQHTTKCQEIWQTQSQLNTIRYYKYSQRDQMMVLTSLYSKNIILRTYRIDTGA